jgi:hypothetical protein
LQLGLEALSRLGDQRLGLAVQSLGQPRDQVLQGIADSDLGA